MKTSFIVLCLGAIVLSGCGEVTSQSKEQAKRLAARVASYRQEQSDRVERLNTTFNDRYHRLSQALDTISARQLLADRNDGAQRIADSLVAKPDSAYRQAIRDAFLADERTNRQEIADADTAITAAQTSYQTAYIALSIPLDKLKKAEDDLRALANLDQGSASQRAMQVFEKVFSAYESLSKSAQAQKSGQPAAPTAVAEKG